jgi:aminopeptidase-like protein
MNGSQLLEFIKLVWPLNRSITGKGTLETLKFIKSAVPECNILSVPSGTRCFDWEIPLEWNVNSAYIIDPLGDKFIDFKDNNLHLVGYSEPVQCKMSLAELNLHLFSLPEQPDLIPYRTSYYDKSWGFCLTENMRKNLVEGEYSVYIDSTLQPGTLNYGEIFIQGKSKAEIVFSTYICHPSMANNELSGPAIAIGIADFLKKIDRYYSYRILFVPETIGVISYLSSNFSSLKDRTLAGYILTCLGDDEQWSFLPSRTGITLSDKVALRTLQQSKIDFTRYSFLDRGSDERQFCSPLIDLPFCSVMRSKYGTYDSYHTSGDDLNFISPKGLEKSLQFYMEVINSFERNRVPKSLIHCEPMFSKRKLRSNIGGARRLDSDSLNLSHVMALSDGSYDFEELAGILDLPLTTIQNLCENLVNHQLITLL